jgi:uncharacterized protein
MSMDEISITREWVEQFVIGLNLCPFAKKPALEGRIRYVLFEGKDPKALGELLAKELLFLQATDPAVVETTLLIHPCALRDFADYNDYLEVWDELLVGLDLEGDIQVASFHPDYQFEGTHPNDPENYTNRSPFPMLHLIREASVERAVDLYPDIDAIPERNIARLNELGIVGILKHFNFNRF